MEEERRLREEEERLERLRKVHTLHTLPRTYTRTISDTLPPQTLYIFLCGKRMSPARGRGEIGAFAHTDTRLHVPSQARSHHNTLTHTL